MVFNGVVREGLHEEEVFAQTLQEEKERVVTISGGRGFWELADWSRHMPGIL